MNRLLLLLLLLVCTAGGMQAQNGEATVKVEITVVDEHGETLPGASVKASDKKVGVVAGPDGKASLWVTRGKTVAVSYLGMKTRYIKISGPYSKTVALESDQSMIDQVVVNGYQKTTKRRITGSVATITEDQLKDNPLANIDQLLQGKIAGVDVKAVSGRPGESAKIRIRGTNTITGNAEPLWVVDGVPLQHDIPTHQQQSDKSRRLQRYLRQRHR